MGYSKRERQHFIACSIGIAFIILAMLFTPPIFRSMDCNNSTRALRTIELCEASGDCMLTIADKRKKANYTRLKYNSCKNLTRE